MTGCPILMSVDNQTKDAKATTVWEGKLQDFIWSFPFDKPRFRHGQWREVFENQIKSNPLSITTSADPLFSLPLGEDQIKWTVWLSRDGVWKRFRTLSQVAMLEGEELEVRALFCFSCFLCLLLCGRGGGCGNSPVRFLAQIASSIWCAAAAMVVVVVA